MPIPIEKIHSLKHLIVHERCPDGTASAMMLKYCFPDLDVQFVQYDTEAHRNVEVRPHTIFADFSPHPDRVGDFVQAESVVLDHHRTAQQVVAEFGELGVFGDETSEPGVCGATLAFREVCKPSLEGHGYDVGHLLRLMEDFAILAGIRDTWQRENPRWREACEQASALDFWPWDRLVGLPAVDWKEKLEIGPILFQKKLDTVKRFGDNALRFVSEKGTKVAVFQGVKMSSDVAEHLHTEVDLVIGFDVFLVDGEPSMVLSTRSHTDFDCGKFCKAHGGGGHTRAAGFKVVLKPDDPQPFELARRIVEKYESA